MHVETNGQSRRKGEFCTRVPISTTQHDIPNSEIGKFGNRWHVTFADEAVSDGLKIFLDDPDNEEKVGHFAPWVFQKIRAHGLTITNGRLWKAIEPPKSKVRKEGEKKIPKSAMHGVLKLMANKNVIAKRPGITRKKDDEVNWLIAEAMQ